MKEFHGRRISWNNNNNNSQEEINLIVKKTLSSSSSQYGMSKESSINGLDRLQALRAFFFFLLIVVTVTGEISAWPSFRSAKKSNHAGQGPAHSEVFD
jgi:hypothetical protein